MCTLFFSSSNLLFEYSKCVSNISNMFNWFIKAVSDKFMIAHTVLWTCNNCKLTISLDYTPVHWLQQPKH